MTGRDFSSVLGSLPPFVGPSVLLGSCAMLWSPWRLSPTTVWLLFGLALLVFVTVRWPVGSREMTGFRSRRLRPEWRSVGAWLWPALLAAAVTAATINQELDLRWSTQDSGERVIGRLKIDSLIEGQGELLEFDAELFIESPDTHARRLRVQVLWRHPPRPLPEVGETWRVLLRLTPPPTRRNPGSFDAERQALLERVHARAHVLPWRATEKLQAGAPGLLTLRSSIAGKIFEQVVDRDAAALFAGLAVGATESVSVEQWRVFSVTGTTHLVAISGMHVTLFAWVMAAAARRLWRVLPSVQATLDREMFAGVLGVLAALGYALLAGFGVPTQRTVVMLAVWWAMRLSAREQPGYQVLGLALVAVWIIDPLAPLSAGFWLSFVAMATLMSTPTDAMSTTRWASWGPWAWLGALWSATRTLMHVQWRIGLALLPLTVAWFSTVSIAGLLVNLLAIPIFSFVLVPLVLLASVLQSLWNPLSRPLWWLAERLHALIWPPMHAIAQSPFAATALSMPAWWLLLAAVVVAVGLFGPTGRWRWPLVGAMTLLLALGLWIKPQPPPGQLQLWLLDAGDSPAVILRTRRHAFVYDTAERFGAPGAGARSIVAPALRELGIGSLDLLVLGSVNNLRLAGSAVLAGLFTIKEIRHAAGWNAPPPGAKPCDRPMHWRRDGVEFWLLPAGSQGQFCVLRAGPIDGPKVLLVERLDRPAARALVEEWPQLLAAEVVLAPRRGSLRALDPRFVQATGAAQVLIGSRLWSEAHARRAADAWGIEPGHLHATAREGSVKITLTAAEPVKVETFAAARRGGVWRARAD